MSQRVDSVASTTETFTYDFLDRLTGVTGAYSNSYAYNEIGNMTSMNGSSYTYGDSGHKHAVTAVGGTSYAYDANGNMTTRDSQTLTWDVENRPTSVTGGASFVYDGDGNRIKKTEGGQTILYINQYYQKNTTTGVVTTSYYLGAQLVAQREGTTLRYVSQDNLGSTSVMTTNNGALDSSISYYPFGSTRTGSVNSDKKFTGQRLDSTGLYYYNARYYDPVIGRFISPDTQGVDYTNPQTLNRYTYCQNNPLKYNDPTGHFSWKTVAKIALITVAVVAVAAVAIVAAPVILTAIAITASMFVGATSVAAVSTAAAGVASATTAMAAAIAPVALAVSTAPLVGGTITTVAGAGLNILGMTRPPSFSSPPDILYHYTSADPAVIRSQGLAPPSDITYGTNLSNLSPQGAQTLLQIPAGRPLPIYEYSIDVGAALQSGATLSGPSWVFDQNEIPTGAWEWAFTGPIPPTAIR